MASRFVRAGPMLLLAAFVAPEPAGATLTGDPVDIRVELDLFFNGSTPKVFEVTQKTVGAGPELTEADEIANPASWTGGVDVDVDGDTGTITITGTGGFVGAGCGGPPCADYGLLDIWLDDLEWVGEVGEVAGVSTLSDNLMDPTRSFPFTLTTSHTADSVHLAWVVDTPPDDVFFVVTGATAVFEIQTTHIPEPTTALLIACGLVGLGVRGRLH